MPYLSQAHRYTNLSLIVTVLGKAAEPLALLGRDYWGVGGGQTLKFYSLIPLPVDTASELQVLCDQLVSYSCCHGFWVTMERLPKNYEPEQPVPSFPCSLADILS